MSTFHKEQAELLELLEYKEKELHYNKKNALFPDTGPYRRDLYKAHIKFISASIDHSQLAFIAANRCLAEGTLVATPAGPVAIENLVPGDTVYDRYGKETLVTDVWDNGIKETISMQNRGKEYFRCTPEHKLDSIEISRHTSRWDEATNKEVILKASEQHRYSLVRRVKVKSELGAEHFSKAYSLGAFLGDGCCTCDTKNVLVISSKDDKIVNRIAEELGGVEFKKNHNSNYSYTFKSKGFDLYNTWCRGRHTHEKQVDLEVIKTWDRISLLNFLAGLIDTDGSLVKGKDGYNLRFTNQSLSIIRAVEYCFLALWNEPVSIMEDRRAKYKNGHIYDTSVRNPHSIKYICEELSEYLTYKHKATIGHLEFGSKSRPEALKLTPVKTGRFEHTYDITVASKDHLFLLANGLSVSNTGKTKTGAYIMACHLTGDYPEWWEGRKYLNAIDAWASGKTNQKTKEIIQLELLGPDNDIGAGMIPKDAILKITKKPGVADAIETVTVRHISGGVSTVTFKSYEQGRDGFEGTKKQVIWLDEEPADVSIYSECLMRTADEHRPGIIYCTFTPLYGLSDVVMKFLPNGKPSADGSVPDNEDLFSVMTTWDDVPHLSTSEKKRLWDGCLPHEREARSRGIPSLGSGAIYPYLEDDIVVDPFKIPEWWPRSFGMDTGWHRTAVVWGAKDPDTGIIYLYSEHYMGKELPPIHASAIKSRGAWIMGASDPAGANISDGKKIFDMYVEEGLNLIKAEKEDREGGILKVSQMFGTGMLKVFSTLTNFLDEFRVYRRDEDGKIIKKKDHLMDAARYLLTTAIPYFSLPEDPDHKEYSSSTSDRDQFTGY